MSAAMEGKGEVRCGGKVGRDLQATGTISGETGAQMEMRGDTGESQ